MLSTHKSAKPLARLLHQLIAIRGQKASTTKLPIVLLKDVDSLGEKGQQVDVSHGFARNYLYPRGQAAPVPTKPRDRHTRLTQHSQEKNTTVSPDLQAVLSVLTKQPIVLKCNVDAAGELVEHIGVEHVASAVRQQLQIELASQLINMSQPFTSLGERLAALHMTLPDGSKPSIQVHLTPLGLQQ